jgi:DNA polymerase-1
VDGRVHAEHRQLGTDSGRQSSRWPNILGIGRVHRPLILASPGYGIGEVDLSQIEVGVSAAFYGDRTLIEMFNTGDVYSMMAQKFYGDDLSDEERGMPGSEFKRRHPEKRARMKIFTLGIIYGMTAHGLAHMLKVSDVQASQHLQRFMQMFPSLDRNLECIQQVGATRGYVATSSGLRRYRAYEGTASSWERNWFRNTPVQGSAAVAFKLAGIRLDRIYQKYATRLLVPLHDSYVFEAPLENLGEVASATARVMCEAVQEFFPELHPQAEVNISHPECWNKDGKADALQRWLEESASEEVLVVATSK